MPALKVQTANYIGITRAPGPDTSAVAVSVQALAGRNAAVIVLVYLRSDSELYHCPVIVRTLVTPSSIGTIRYNLTINYPDQTVRHFLPNGCNRDGKFVSFERCCPRNVSNNRVVKDCVGKVTRRCPPLSLITVLITVPRPVLIYLVIVQLVTCHQPPEAVLK